MSTYQQFVGVDVSSQSLMVSINGHTPFEILQNKQGWTRLYRKLRTANCLPNNTLVVMEATGSYSMKPAHFLQNSGFAVSIVNPLQSHYFSRSHLQNTKTDARDAQLLAQLAQQLQPPIWTPAPPICEELHLRLTQRDLLIRIRQQVRNQHFDRQHHPFSVAELNNRAINLLALLKTHLNDLDRELKQLLRQDSPWRDNAQLLLSIPGIGTITAAWLLVGTQNFAHTRSADELASFCGLIPHRRQSGKQVSGKHRVRYAGHQRLRTALYEATFSAAQSNPLIQAFYRRLRDKGKTVKVARIAAAHKLVQVAWAVVSKQQAFDPLFPRSRSTLSVKPNLTGKTGLTG